MDWLTSRSAGCDAPTLYRIFLILADSGHPALQGNWVNFLLIALEDRKFANAMTIPLPMVSAPTTPTFLIGNAGVPLGISGTFATSRSPKKV